MTEFQLIEQTGPMPSPMPGSGSAGSMLRVGAVQCARSPDPGEHTTTLRTGVAMAAARGAEVVALQELPDTSDVRCNTHHAGTSDSQTIGR